MPWIRQPDGSYTNPAPKYAHYKIAKWGSGLWALTIYSDLATTRSTLQAAKLLAAYYAHGEA